MQAPWTEHLNQNQILLIFSCFNTEQGAQIGGHRSHITGGGDSLVKQGWAYKLAPLGVVLISCPPELRKTLYNFPEMWERTAYKRQQNAAPEYPQSPYNVPDRPGNPPHIQRTKRPVSRILGRTGQAESPIKRLVKIALYWLFARG